VSTNSRLRDRILDVATDIVVNDGVPAATSAAIAHRAGLDPLELEELYPSSEQLFSDLLHRMYDGIRRSVADSIERDPSGGLLSRIFFYSLGAVHERPLSRALYLEDPAGLHQIIRLTHDTESFPRLGPDLPFLHRMRDVGMIRPDVDLGSLFAFLTAYMTGAALAASRAEVDAMTAGLVTLLERGVDAEVDDTEPGKRAMYELLGRHERD
jgi:AcrR family transcriptional regulator